MTGAATVRATLLLSTLRFGLLVPAAMTGGLIPGAPGLRAPAVSPHTPIRVFRLAIAAPVAALNCGRGGPAPVARTTPSRAVYPFVPLHRYQVGRVLRHYGSPFQNAWVWSVMIGAARQYNVSPYLMLAVAWQEQSLASPSVAPASWVDPWNAGVSWQDWHGSYQEAADLAAKALRAKLDAPGRPAGVGVIGWIENPANPAGMWAISQSAGGKAVPTPGWVTGVQQALQNLKADRVPG